MTSAKELLRETTALHMQAEHLVRQSQDALGSVPKNGCAIEERFASMAQK